MRKKIQYQQFVKIFRMKSVKDGGKRRLDEIVLARNREDEIKEKQRQNRLNRTKIIKEELLEKGIKRVNEL